MAYPTTRDKEGGRNISDDDIIIVTRGVGSKAAAAAPSSVSFRAHAPAERRR